MSVAMGDGPLGLESKLVWAPSADPRALGAPITLNDNWNADGSIKKPRYKVDRITGLRSLPEAEDNRGLRTGRTGEVPYASMARGRTITVEGRMQATSLQQLRQMETALVTAFSDRTYEGTLSFLPHAAWGDVSACWQIAARALSLDVEDSFTTSPRHVMGPHTQVFTLSLRASDPRYFWSAPENVAGGAGVVVTNLGSAPDDPVISATIASLQADVYLFNESILNFDGNAAKLRFRTVPAGTLAVDFATRQITLNGSNASHYLAPAFSEWWDVGYHGLIPGANNLTSTGVSALSVTFKHRSW